MTRLLCISALAIGLFTSTFLPRNADAQSLIIGRGGVQYNGYGRGYYGGYGAGYRGYGQGYNRFYYGPRTQAYSAYGNGPYGYGTNGVYQVPYNNGYGYGNGNYTNGYGTSGYYTQPYAPAYRPYGFGVYIQ